MRDHAGLGQPAVRAACRGRHIVALLRQPFDVRLVDDGVFPRRLRPRLVAPGMRHVDHHGLVHRAGIVAPVERQVLLLVAGAVAEMRIGPGEMAAELLAVGIDQQLVRIEAVARFRRVGPVHAIAVELARRDVGEIDVPDVLGALRQRDALDFASAVAVEQAKLDLGGVGGEQGEVGAAAVPIRAQRIGRASRNVPVRPQERGRWQQGVGRQGEAPDCHASERENGAGVPDIAAAVNRRIRIEHLAPVPGKGHPHAIIAQDLRREIYHDDAAVGRIPALAQPGKGRVGGIVGDQPFEAGGIAIERMQRRRLAVELVEVAHQPLHAGVAFLLGQVPGQADVVVPFGVLAEFRAHEHQLLAGMAEHEGVIGAQIGKALPLVARHAAEDRAFAVHDFVVRQRQDEVFREGVVQPEQNIAVVVAAVDRILGDVVQGVVHPAHVPLVAEAEPAPVDRPRHHGPGGRFLGRGGGVRIVLEQFRVGAAQEGDRVDVLAPAESVRDPARRPAGCNRDRASRPPHRRAGRRRRSDPARTARSTRENW